MRLEEAREARPPKEEDLRDGIYREQIVAIDAALRAVPADELAEHERAGLEKALQMLPVFMRTEAKEAAGEILSELVQDFESGEIDRQIYSRAAPAGLLRLGMLVTAVKELTNATDSELAVPVELGERVFEYVRTNHERLLWFLNEGPTSTSGLVLTMLDGARYIAPKHENPQWNAHLHEHRDLIMQGLQSYPDFFSELAQFVPHFGEHPKEREKFKTVIMNRCESGKFDMLASLLASSDPDALTTGQACLMEYLKCDLRTALELSDWWAAGAGKEKGSLHIEVTLKTMQQLESRHKGAVQELYDRSVRDFGRYGIKTLEHMYLRRNDDTRPHGVILFPKDDWNGAFYQDNKELDTIVAQLERTHNIRIVECDSKFSAARGLVGLYKKYGPMSFAVIGGHGETHQIRLGNYQGRPGNDKYLIKAEDLTKRGVRRTGSLFVPKPSVILVSCWTGADEGIGEQLGEEYDATVIAPRKPTNLKSVGVREVVGTVPHFDVEYQDGSQRTIAGARTPSQNRFRFSGGRQRNAS